ncbi:MAG: hypothetical protein A3G34_01625 [Candidatus Lindowbacteria bacterium RIFCSPLOWO2_12_FULL_62_27]|nr:MAG: hypothetical protein A3I06_05560 [Candidatus Lindowbacteria bacterium RIFCSPLOWO2_02_FULL_62_12]OGH59011.1 MAG: hypothetical protein A3G34_01625 [Candidatus Lindowbacteria bacterium RIFCSPLOWO2_12_FULL_62_27]
MKREPGRLTPEKLEALYRLLQDDDSDVVASLAASLKRMSEADLRTILEFWQARSRSASETPAQPPAIALALRLSAVDRFCALMAQPVLPELETGAFLISAWGRPDLPERRSQLKLDAYASRMADTIPRRQARENPAASARELCRYLFEEIGFRGNEENYHDPDNSFLSAVIDRRRGIPISLSVLTLLIARRMTLNLLPIGAPNRFLLAVRENSGLTYIDCYGGGQFLNAAQARPLLGEVPEGFDPFPEVNSNEILARMLRNLHVNYRQAADEARVLEVERMLSSVTV